MTDPLPPTPPELPAELEPYAPALLEHEAALADVELADLQLPRDAKGVAFSNASLVRVDLSASRLEALQITDASLKGCELANVYASGGSLWRVDADSCRLTGVQLTDATLRDVTISSSRVDLATFAFSKLTRVTFEGCNLAQAAFLDATLESVRFHDCDLKAADFRGAKLRGCEFRRSELDGIQGVEYLRGAAMSWFDIVAAADVFADALGIAVIDEEGGLEQPNDRERP
jgi:uncharacterized protein YjbI with pentapeptide repeats